MKIQLALGVAATAAISASATAQAPLHVLHGQCAGGHLGQTVACLDDIDGDGTRDFAVGAPDELVGGVARGAVRVCSGATGAVLHALVGQLDGEQFGASIAGIADRDGDGIGELLIGAPSNDAQFADLGKASIYSAATGALVVSYTGSAAGDKLGQCVANVGDLDGDGVDDYAVALPEASNGAIARAGRMQAFSGATGGALFGMSSTDADAHLGAALAAAGDFDGDGYGDLLVGAPGYTGVLASQGRAYVLSGHTGAVLKTWNGSFANSAFGAALAQLGDLDGDGKSEIAVGAPLASAGGVERGRVSVFHGGNGLFLGAVDGFDGWHYGASLASAGDWNGDGSPDLAIGAPGFCVLGVSTPGALRIHNAGTGALLATLIGFADGSRYGDALAASELNGDGASELLVGAPAEAKLAADAGSARLLLSGAIKPFTYCSAKTNSLGCTPQIDFAGAPSLSVGDNFHITATNVIGQKAGMLFWGLAKANLPYHGGTFCVSAPVVRTAAQNSGGASDACDGHYDLHFRRDEMLAHGLAAGTDVYAQYWSRDPGLAQPDNVGLTNALHFEIAP